ncbi:hypothetical protein Tco_1439958 [Tanacetum coccineum]
MLLPKEDNVNMGKRGLDFENKNDVENPSLFNKAKELAPSLYNTDEIGKDLLFDHKIISEEELKCEAEKRLKVKQRISPLSFEQSYEQKINKRVRNRLCEEFEPLVKDINLQLNCFEKGLVKEMQDDLKCVTSLEDEFDEKCLILDIQKEFFKTQFELAISESHSHVYENAIFKQKSSLENENRCLKKTITDLLKQVADVKEEMTCPNSLTSVQNGHVLSDKSDEAKIKFDIEDLETINIELEFCVASLLKENEHLKKIYQNLFDSIKHSWVQTTSSNISQNEAENLKSQLSEFANKKFAKVFQKIESMKMKNFDLNLK